ncbi:helix-turn-helix domain-containing protein [Roseateles sp.]|uniref:helix-turn-helix domain-containing protein n=1 Tax=Roseateles sp. TaxID=1971397 RepID=UPI0039EA78A8
MAAAVKTIRPANVLSAEVQSEHKFGRSVMSHGFYLVPALLLRGQARLKLTSTQMVVLLQLLDFWWTVDTTVHPSIKAIAERVGLTAKQVQRTIGALDQMGLITRVNRTLPDRGKTSNQYKFDGLIAKLNELEPDYVRAHQAASSSAGDDDLGRGLFSPEPKG